MIHNKRRLQIYTAIVLTALMLAMGGAWATHALTLYRHTLERQIAEDNHIAKENLMIIVHQIARQYADEDGIIAQIQSILESLQDRGWKGFACVLDKDGRVLAHPNRNMVDMQVAIKTYQPTDLLGHFPPPVAQLPEMPNGAPAMYKTQADIIAIGWLPDLMAYLCVHKSHLPIAEKIDALRSRLVNIGIAIATAAGALSWFFLGALVDRYENHLSRSEARNRTLVQNSAPILIASPSGDIIDANPEAATLFSMDRNPLLAKRIRDVWTEKYQRELEMLLSVPSGQTKECRDIDLSTGNGRTIPVDVRACRIDYGDSEAVYFLIRDVTETRRAREEMLAANRRLRELDQLKTDFINTVSHELRTPLTSIHWSTESLSSLVSNGGDTVDKLFKIIREDNRRLSKLIEELLGFARLDAGKIKLAIQRTDLSHIVEMAKLEVQTLAQKKSIAISHSTGTAPLPLQADADQMRRAVVNLLENAIKYTPEGGAIDIRISQKEGLASLEIADTGIGIPEKDLPYIFEKFYRTDQVEVQRERGTGLGLPIAQRIVKAHGGIIDVKSLVGKGAAFTVHLPVEEPEEASSGP